MNIISKNRDRIMIDLINREVRDYNWMDFELDRLIAKSDGSFNSPTEDDPLKTVPEIVTKYDYDKRGNLIAEYENDILTKRHSFNDPLTGLFYDTDNNVAPAFRVIHFV